ncbi:MAG: hypothetical protein IT324_02010 [Anaerolineae bacterium]|nr:hypothetical protein [Anaerolineae bacterium]
MNAFRKILTVLMIGLAVNLITPLIPDAVLAQGKTCPEIVKAALANTNRRCGNTQRNQACYGNITVDAKPQPNAVQFRFDRPGDIISLEKIQALQLSAMNPAAATWGVVVLRVQANFPDTVRGQNVTMLLFGDVSIQDVTKTAATETSTAYKTMQAFYFRTGVGTPTCREAPPDGILIQNPSTRLKVDFMINEVRVVMGSTVFIRATSYFSLVTLKGTATVTAAGITVTVPAGYEVRIPLNSSGNAGGPPGQIAPYNPQALQALPLRNLPITVTLVTPIPPTRTRPAATATPIRRTPTAIPTSQTSTGTTSGK